MILPGVPPQLDLANPLAQGLGAYVLTLLGGYQIELVGRRSGNFTENAPAQTPFGLGAKVTAEATTPPSIPVNLSFPAGNGTGFTLACVNNVVQYTSTSNGDYGLYVSGSGNIGVIFNGDYYGSSSFPTQWGAGWADGTNSLDWNVDNALQTAANWNLYTVVFGTSGGLPTIATYLNAAPQSGITGEGNPNLAFTATSMSLGGIYSTSGYGTIGTHVAGWVWPNKALSQADVSAHYGQVLSWLNGGDPPMAYYPAKKLLFPKRNVIPVPGLLGGYMLSRALKNPRINRRRFISAIGW